MKVRIEEEEILIDFTGKELKSANKNLMPVILKKNYILKIHNTIPKKTAIIAGKSINPHYYTCSCKDYRMNADKYPKRDFRRICKHLFIYLSKYYFEEINLLTRTILEHKFWYRIFNVIEVGIEKNIFYMGYTADFELFNIYIPSNLPDFYSYNCSLKKWKNFEEPFPDSELNNAIVKLMHRLNIFYKNINRQK